MSPDFLWTPCTYCFIALLQVGNALPRPKKAAERLAEAGRWIAAKDLVKLIDTATQQVVAAMKGSPMTPDLARLFHDAVLASTVFGYLPPLRLSCIRSLQHYKYTGPCLDPGCSDPACHGNIVVLLSEKPLQMGFKLPHHKNEVAWGHKAIEFTLPQAYAELLYAYLGKPHEELCSFHNFCDEADCTFAFMSKKGQGFDNPTFSVHWTRWLCDQGAPAMPPSMCRQVFVEERRSDDRVAGPSDQGASLIMGHSVSQWDAWYDTHFHSRLGQNAVNQMLSWRETLLLQGANSQPLHAEAAAGPSMTASALASPNTTQPDTGYMSCGTVDLISEEEDIVIDLLDD